MEHDCVRQPAYSNMPYFVNYDFFSLFLPWQFFAGKSLWNIGIILKEGNHHHYICLSLHTHTHTATSRTHPHHLTIIIIIQPVPIGWAKTVWWGRLTAKNFSLDVTFFFFMPDMTKEGSSKKSELLWIDPYLICHLSRTWQFHCEAPDSPTSCNAWHLKKMAMMMMMVGIRFFEGVLG